MHVYFIVTNARPSLVKIGKSKNPDERMAALQTGCPYSLRMLGTVACNSEMHADHVEKKLHHMLRNARVQGEWFRLTRQVDYVLKRLIESPGLPVGELASQSFFEFRQQYRTERRHRRRNQRSPGIPVGSTGPRSK